MNNNFNLNENFFIKGSKYKEDFLKYSYLCIQFYLEKRDSLEGFLRDRKQSVSSTIRNLSKKIKLNQEDITIIKEFNLSIFPRISESEYSYIKKRAIFIFTYSGMEQYFFRCMKYCFTKISQSEIQAEKDAEDLMRNPWKTIFDGFKTLHRLNHNLNNNLINELQKFKVIRNLFVHGNGTINQNYLGNFPNSHQNFGEKLNLIPKLIFKYFNLSVEIIAYFDAVLLKIFPELTYKP